ncbi:MAG: hypothetical protein IJP99_10615 [Methanobrevibacter sp.]|nr:hypothetical protein [Methanobrevibacter sp.]MBR0059770.1 hypothetical protein [Methanobrevibacter sp.]
MTRKARTIVTNITFETKALLDTIKYDGESYNDVLEKLLYLEEKYNSDKEVVSEYELSIDDMTQVVRIVWRKNSYSIYYYNDIRHQWYVSPKQGLNKDYEDAMLLLDSFISMMSRDDIRPLLMSLEDELTLDGLIVKRLV